MIILVTSRSDEMSGGDELELCCPPWMQLARAFVPYQPLRPRKMDAKSALRKGTLFPHLYRPYEQAFRHYFWGRDGA